MMREDAGEPCPLSHKLFWPVLRERMKERKSANGKGGPCPGLDFSFD